MMLVIKSVLVFVAFIYVHGYSPQNQPVCNIVTVGDFIPRKVPKVVNVDPSCNHGNVEYHYTVSPLDVWFRKSGRYRVCISSNAMKDWEHFSISVVTKAKCRQIGKPSKGHDVCVDNNYGTLKLRIQHDVKFGPMYMFLIPYKISEIPPKPKQQDKPKSGKMKKSGKIFKKLLQRKLSRGLP